MSSAYNFTEEETPLDVSYIYITYMLHKMGPKIVPWNNCRAKQRVAIDLSQIRKEDHQYRIFLAYEADVCVEHTVECFDLEMSKRIRSIGFLFLRDFAQSLKQDNSCDV